MLYIFIILQIQELNIRSCFIDTEFWIVSLYKGASHEIMEEKIMSISIDDELKEEFEKVCNEIGLDVSTVINIFMETTIKEHKIPFDYGDDLSY